MSREIFKIDTQVRVPLTKLKLCLQEGRLQHTSKPRLDSPYIHEDVEVLKFRCRGVQCVQRIREVIAGVRGDCLDEALVNADRTAALIRKVVGCRAELDIVNTVDL